jgi:hypothetical protein
MGRFERAGTASPVPIASTEHSCLPASGGPFPFVPGVAPITGPLRRGAEAHGPIRKGPAAGLHRSVTADARDSRDADDGFPERGHIPLRSNGPVDLRNPSASTGEPADRDGGPDRSRRLGAFPQDRTVSRGQRPRLRRTLSFPAQPHPFCSPGRGVDRRFGLWFWEISFTGVGAPGPACLRIVFVRGRRADPQKRELLPILSTESVRCRGGAR